MSKTKCRCTVCDHMFYKDGATVLEHQDQSRILDMSAFMLNCPACKKQTVFEQPIMYQHMSDDSRGTFIWLNPQPNDAPQGLVDAFASQGIHGGFHRIVESPEEFAEKIRIGICGYDDRAVEIVKCMALLRLHNDQPHFRMHTARFAIPKGKSDPTITLYGLDGEKTSFPFIESMYEMVVARFEDEWQHQHRDKALLINDAWAISAFLAWANNAFPE